MKFLFALFFSAAASSLVVAQECSTTWMCQQTSTPPTLDGEHDEWSNVDAYTTTLMMTTGTEWDAGVATYKCMYDTERIYFAMEIPGEYRFSSEDNHLCASIATMFKVGSKATYVNMGGCPDAMGGCEGGVPDTCSDYRVDIGAHWELSGTNMSTPYVGMEAASSSGRQAGTSGTGNDLVANNDDEYAVSPYCRFDDDDANAGNEWSGAWKHTNPTDGEFGTYHFEVSRTLKTASLISDVQLSPGETYQFGLAFWDPFESESGWTDIGHYVTGCATKWIDLELAVPGSEVEDPADDTSGTTTEAVTDDSSVSEARSVFVAGLAAISLIVTLY